ncbi:MAG: tRNA lysidine(34) synthetase TilS [Phycisphaeraceae bacterium]|nr:tRNA lysidine(34) synthetase TilS [Phycisphaeraceae bacterium]
MPHRTMVLATHPFVKKIASAARRHCGVGTGAKIIVATSGGADSVALLRALAVLAPRRRWDLKLTVGHIHHHLRDTDGAAEKDAVFVDQLAEELGLDYQRRDLDLQQPDEQNNLEARARMQRYQALSDIAVQTRAKFVATGHHGDDLLETMLMKFLRGSSVRGLRAMSWDRYLQEDIRLIRPMLGVDHQAALQFVSTLGQTWREDLTNNDRHQHRARLRHEVMPVLRQIRPNAAGKALALSQHARSMTQLLDASVSEAYDQIVIKDTTAAITIDRCKAQQLVHVVLCELLRLLLVKIGARVDSLSQRAVEPILTAIMDRKGRQREFHLDRNVHVLVSKDACLMRRNLK